MTDKNKLASRKEEKHRIDETLGAKLSAARKKRQLSQRELARRSGSTNTAISLIEAGRISPSLSSIKKLLDAMGISLSEFFSDNLETEGRKEFYKSKDLRLVAHGKGVDVYQVGGDSEADPHQMLVGKYASDGDTGEQMLVHAGEEIGYIASGRFKVTVGDSVVVLNEGEGFRFSSTIPHRFTNISGKPGVIVSVSTPRSI
jgi:transcriptional regulator with XRE-family HTH domain